MYVKTAVLLAAFAGAYVLLVLVAQTWWQGLLLAVILGLSAAGIGFNVQHDGGHQAYSSSRRVNTLMAMALELLGGSSYLWRWKHGVFHHTYVNITGHDTDIDLGILARLTPHQRRLAFHQWQHLYLWPLYGLLVIKWQLVDDFRKLITGRISTQPFPRPKGWDLVILVAGKVVFFAVAFGIPLQFHSIGVVLCYYGVVGLVAGIMLSVVFQVAHCVEDVEFPVPQARTGRIDRAWAIHQVETTADFARNSRVVAWLVGGLNFQIEHHLLPRISHVNYPALSTLVEQTCQDFGIRYTAFKSFRAGLASHFRWLRRMGMPDEPAGLPPLVLVERPAPAVVAALDVLPPTGLAPAARRSVHPAGRPPGAPGDWCRWDARDADDPSASRDRVGLAPRDLYAGGPLHPRSGPSPGGEAPR